MNRITAEDTIVAVSTPVGEGGIGIVRLSGQSALEIAGRIFVPKSGKAPSKSRTHSVRYGHIIKTGYENPVDEVLLTVMKAPRTYTREDIVEINCHGGIQAVKEVLGLVIGNGARLAEPGEFTKRAFLNGRLDLAQAEAVLDLVRAKTEGSRKAAVNQLEGVLSKEVNDIRDSIVKMASQVEASIDFPEEGLEAAEKTAFIEEAGSISAKLKRLSDSYAAGAILREGVLAVICGKPNVGKSSLMNLLLKRDRVIVSPVPGTTRDAIEEMVNIRGILARLVDTAGIARARDTVGKEGVKKSKSYLALADIVILMLDASAGIDEKDVEVAGFIGNKAKLVVINKCDLKRRLRKPEAAQVFKKDKIVEISVREKMGIDLLERSIAEAVWSGRYNQAEASVVTNARHKELLDKALRNMLSVKKALDRSGRSKDYSPELIAIDLKEAIFNVGLIVGKSVSDDILNRIFEDFCIGK